MEKEITLACDNYSDMLVKGISELYSNKKSSDLIVEYKNQKLFLHTFMLDIFAPQLLRRFDDNNCQFEDEHVTVQILNYIFQFLYTGQVRVEEHELSALRKSAEQLGVTLLEDAILKSTAAQVEEKQAPFLNNKDDLMQYQDIRNNFEDETTRIIIVNMGNRDKTESDILCEENEPQIVFGEEIVTDKDIQSNKEIFVEGESDKEEEEPSLLKSLLKKSRVSCYSCNRCDFQTDQKLLLNRHHHNVHDTDRPLKCERCDYRGKTKKLLNIHMATHGTETYPCALCSKTFRAKFVLYKHVSMFHKENSKKNACHLCTFQSRYVTALDRHLLKVHRIPRELNRAMGRPAIASVGSILSTSNFESFDAQCSYCEFKCKGRAVLDDHLAVKHGVDGDGNAVQDKYQCKHCEFACVAKYQLRTHFSQKHAKKLKCEKCDFSCIGKDALDSHFKFRHLGVKAFMCETCGLQLASEGCLRRHLFIHKTGQKHTCNLCEKSFSQQWYLVKHVKLMHDDVEPKHKCPHCEFSSKLRGNLNQHIQRMHKNAAKVLAVRNQK